MARATTRRNSSRLRSFLICLLSLAALLVCSWRPGSKTRASSDVLGKPLLRVGSIVDMKVAYSGESALVTALQSNHAQPRTLASADLDRDGAPDLIAGYALDGKGVVTVQRGNPEAFAPKDESIYVRMQQGYNPDSLSPVADTYLVPERPDFLHVGDFNHDNSIDVLVGMRGGDLFLLSGDSRGGLSAPEQVSLSGTVTSIATGEFRAADGWTDVAVGVESAAGPAVLIFDGQDGLAGDPMRVLLKAPASALQIERLDDDPFGDIAAAVGDEIEIIHGWSRKQEVDPQKRIEHVSSGYRARDLAVGFFVWNRQVNCQIAALSNDGTVHILDRAGSDARPFTAQELAKRSKGQGRQKHETVDVESAADWQPAAAATWIIVREIAGSGPVAGNVFQKSHLSYGETDDILMSDAGGRKLNVVRQSDEKHASQSSRDDLVSTIVDIDEAPTAFLALPQKLNGHRDLIVTKGGNAIPTVIQLAPTATITVDRTDDTAAATACTGAANDCSLRGAVINANAAPGTVISIPAGTYTLSIAGDANDRDFISFNPLIGDLNANGSGTTIMGAGSATTTIQQTTFDRILVDNATGAAGFTFSVSGLKMTGGRYNEIGRNIGGAGLFVGGNTNTTTFTNCLFVNNIITANPNQGSLGGGAVNITGGNVTITGCTFGGIGATDPNQSVTSGGGLAYDASDFLTLGLVGTMGLTNSTFTNNQAMNHGGGLTVSNSNLSMATVNLSGCAFTGNHAMGSGGAIVLQTGQLNVASSSFTNNSAQFFGGGIHVGGGPGMLLDGSSGSVTFTGNTAPSGGSSVSNSGLLTVSGTQVSIGGSAYTSTNGTWTNNAGSTLSPTDFVIAGGIFNANNSTMNVSGNLSLTHEASQGGTFNGGTGTINIQGNMNIDLSTGGSGAAGQFNAGTGSFNFNGTAPQSITNTASGITFNNLTDSNVTQPLTANNNFAVGGTLNINGANAIFAPVAGAVISGVGNLTGIGTARVTRTGADSFFGQYSITTKTLTNLTVEYIGAAAQTASVTTYSKLKINNGSGVALGAGTTTVNGLLTLQTGALGVGTSTLVLNNGTTVGGGSLTSGATGTVNYNQSSAGQSVIAANYGNLTFSAFTKVLASTGTIGVAGTFNPNGVTSGHTITGSTIDFNGTGAQTVPVFNYNNLTISSARGVNNVTLVNGGTIGVAGAFTPTATFGGGNYVVTNNTVDFNGSGAQTIPAFNYNNLTSSNGGARTLANSGTIGIGGVFTPGANVYTIAGSTINFNGAGAQTIPAFNYNNLTSSNAGARTLANTGTIGIAGALTPGGNAYTITGSTIDFNGGGAQTIPAFSYNNLTSSNAGARTLANAGTIGIGAVFTPGTNTFTITGSTIDFNGSGAQTIPAFNYNNLTSSNTGTRTLANTGTIGIQGVFTPGSNVYTITGSTVSYNGSSAQTMPASFTTYNNLTLNNVAGVTGFAGLIVQGLLRVQSGTFTSSSTYNSVQIDNGATLSATAASTINIGGSWTNNGTFNANTGTVVFNGSSAQTISGTTTFNNLTINNASGVSLAGGTNVTVGATLTLTAGAFGIGTSTLTLNGAVSASGGSLTSGASGTVNYNQSSNGQAVLAVNYGNLTFSNFNKTLPSSGTVGIAGIFTPGSATGHTITSSTVDFNGGGSQTVPAFTYNNLTSSSSGGRTLTNSGNIGIAGVFTPGTNVYTITGSTVVFNGASAQSLPSTFTTYNNLTLNNAAGTTGFAGLTVLGLLRIQAGTFTSSSTYKDVQIDSGATLAATAGSTINCTGNWTNNGTFTPNSGILIFNGSAVQSISGSSTSTFNNLTINNAAGVNLSADIAINALLTLQAGALAIGSRTLTLNNAISIGSGSFTSAANGTVNYNQSSNGQSVAPGNYGNLTFSNFQKTLPGSGTVKIAGVFTTGAGGGHTLTGSRVEFNGASAQTLPSNFTTYNNLTLNNAAGVTGFAGLTVQGLVRVQAGTFTTSSSFKDVQIDSGATLAAVAASTINISGNWTNSGTFNANTGTVVFNGSSAQTISGTTTFNNLTIDNTSGVSLGGSTNVTVGAALTLTSGALSIGTQTLTLNGAVTATSGSLTSGANGTVNYNQGTNGQAVLAANYGNLTFSNFTKTLPSTGTVRIAGSFTTGAGGGHTVTGSTVEYNGSGAQTAPAGFGVYNNLTINNAAGVSLGGDATVGGLFTLTIGNLNAGANTLQLTAAATISRTSGHVLGNLRKTFSATGPFTYTVGTANGYSPVDVNITAGTGDLSVKANQGTAPATPALDSAKTLQRYWTLSGTGITANLVFNYLESDVMGTEANYRVIRVSSMTAVSFANACPSAPCVDPANNTATINGITSFSDWTAGDFSGPTSVEMNAMAATGYDTGNLLEWQTGSEADNLGFNVYRDDRGTSTPINPQIIAGSALMIGSGVTLGAGRTYRWWDAAVKGSAAQYWIEAIDLDGKRSLHGPVSVKQVGGAPAEKSSAAMLSRLGIAQSMVTKPLGVTAPLVLAKPDQAKIIDSLAGQSAVKLSVKREGFYRVSGADLFAAGLDPKAKPEKIQLYVDGIQVPIKVDTDNEGRIASVEFYGIGLDTAATDTRVYWLIEGAQAGLRIAEVKGNGSPTTSTSFSYTVERRDRTVYFSGLRNGERENFFGGVIAGEPVDQTLLLRDIDTTVQGQATIELALQGVTTLQHRVSVNVNGTFAGELQFEGKSNKQATINVAQSLLVEGVNTVRLTAQGGPSDVSLVDYIQITYRHTFTAEDNLLRLTADGGQAITVSGFGGATIRVFDVTDTGGIEEIGAKVEQHNGGYSATFASPRAGERKFLALANERADRPVGITANQASNLRSKSNAAALVIITRSDFYSAFDPLVQLRAGQGIKTELINIEDIYDEFSFGNKTPQAVKDFLLYAKSNWRSGPRFVLMGGDSSYDPKNYLGFGDWDIAPSKLIDTALMETESDDWLGDFDNDGLPELGVGRLPARSAEEAATMVAKIIGYESASPSEEMLLVADVNDGFDFEGADAELKTLIPPNLRVNEIKRGGLDIGAARGLLFEAINRGQRIVNYTGHGSVDIWRANLLTSDDTRLLENRGRPSLFIMMTCLNGYTHDPALDSLAKALVKADGGAAAVWSSSGMTQPAEQAEMNRELYRILFGASGQSMLLGDLTTKAKSAITDQDIRRTWILIGDPTMKLR
ncbi:MAG TPA: C25 family cysteine peptidase [Blastocatellia bacterium]|nr:C25 family cysteine peptidase [Blastocatellia bacterium]